MHEKMEQAESSSEYLRETIIYWAQYYGFHGGVTWLEQDDSFLRNLKAEREELVESWSPPTEAEWEKWTQNILAYNKERVAAYEKKKTLSLEASELLKRIRNKLLPLNVQIVKDLEYSFSPEPLGCYQEKLLSFKEWAERQKILHNTSLDSLDKQIKAEEHRLDWKKKSMENLREIVKELETTE